METARWVLFTAMALLAPAGMAVAEEAATEEAPDAVGTMPASPLPQTTAALETVVDAAVPAVPDAPVPMGHPEDAPPGMDDARAKVQALREEFQAQYREWKREQRALYLAEAADIRADLRAAIQELKADWRSKVAAWEETCGAEEPAEGGSAAAGEGCGQERAAINREANRALRRAHEEAQQRKADLHEEMELALQEKREALLDEMRFAIEDLMDSLGAFGGGMGMGHGVDVRMPPRMERPEHREMPGPSDPSGAQCTPDGRCKPPPQCVGHIGETPECTPPPECKDLGDGTYQCDFSAHRQPYPAKPEPARPGEGCKYDGTRLVCAGQLGTAGCWKASDGRFVCEGRPAEGTTLPAPPSACKFDPASGRMVCSNTMGSIACTKAADGRIVCSGQQGTTAPPPEPAEPQPVESQPAEPQPAASGAEPEPAPATTQSTA